MKVNLNLEQQNLRNIIEEKLKIIRSYIHSSQFNNYEGIQKEEKAMGDAAHKLHMQLEPKPKHHSYMIKNRGLKPEHPEFYYHVHPVEDLLSYLDDTSANDDPVDHTLNAEFSMEIYTNRWGHYDTYHLTRNEKGWHVSHLSHSEQGGRDAEPILGYILRHDSVSYPRDLSYLMEDIWYRAQDEGLTYDQVQTMLQEVADWVSLTEKNYPNHIAR
ncbi:hypothetical protein R7236_25710 [Priestia megaterium]|uniref:hypothetical protein n=1 Tax=Priestia megaterium TaxID=1404 RepID=UPI00296FEB07|nr:hypothetical protein [Priestia megaterium]MDW4511791.1 hypothetical protein [Priestia megaterium]